MTVHTAVVDKARILVEALPYITRFSGKVVVVKYGGNAMIDPQLAASFARDVALMHYVGMRPVVVHGGGPQISELMRKLDQQPQFVDGYRVTGSEELDTVRMVLQKTNKELVAMLNGYGDIAVGISGEDAGLIKGRKMSGRGGADLGFVGEVERIDPRVIQELLKSGFIPVVAPIGVGRDGQALNINADRAAGAVAAALLRELGIEVDGAVVTDNLERRVDEARAARDTVGGVVEVRARGVAPGLGSYATRAERLDARLAAAEERLDGAIAYRALVRYDAYGELSGHQSTSLALLDAARNGVVLSCIAHRDTARLYCKQVHDGRGEHELSPEEDEAIRLALTGEAPRTVTLD